MTNVRRTLPRHRLRYSFRMTPVRALLLSGVVCLGCHSLMAQEKSPRDRLLNAHGQYYTPTASGLKSFRCDGVIDWKAMLTRLSGTDIADDNPAVQFLRTVHLSVVDELKGKGSLEWTSSAPLPAGKEEGINQIRNGLQTSVGGFFQSWNAYMNGSMVPLPDSTLTITPAGTGFHLSGSSQGMKIDEDFDQNMVLSQVLVMSPNIKVLARPTYTSTANGLIVSAVTSKMNQPPSAPEVEATFRIDYAKVDAFQIPSRVVFDVKTPASSKSGSVTARLN